MALACQRNSYLKEFTSKVLSCKPAQVTIVQGGKKTKVQCHEVILEDTILFPEGGGQPDDRGTIGDSQIVKVERRGATAVHYALAEVTPESEVNVKVDWDRRFDHMQQHTGQHLITAIADRLFGFKTTSWNLGEQISSIELDTPTMTEAQLLEVETVINEKILEQVPVVPQLFQDKNDPTLSQFRARGLPDDHEGPVRVLDIKDIDATLCCGTHVSNLSHLQAIKMLGIEKGKKNKTNVTFVAGGRLLKYLARSYQVEKELTAVLKGPLDKHTELADKAVKGFKTFQKLSQSLLKDLAILEADAFNNKAKKENIFCHFRKDADADYMNVLVSQVLNGNPDCVCLVCVGDDKESGLFTLAGPENIVADMGPKLAEVLEAKGAVSGGRYRGKANKMGQRNKAEKILREFLSSHNAQTSPKVEIGSGDVSTES